MRAQEARGLIGFHCFDRCPNCVVKTVGAECWGENGHLQATLPAMPRESDIPELTRRFSRTSPAEIKLNPKGGWAYYA